MGVAESDYEIRGGKKPENWQTPDTCTEGFVRRLTEQQTRSFEASCIMSENHKINKNLLFYDKFLLIFLRKGVKWNLKTAET